MIGVRRAGNRFRAEYDRIMTWHCFSAGAHYDPDNVAFGPLIACDEHVLAPGAGFARHAHAGVELITWVLEGELRHQDMDGRDVVVRPGHVQRQIAGRGIEHLEGNASGDAPLRFVQLWLLCDVDEPGYEVSVAPVRLAAGMLSVHHDGPLSVAPDAHLFVCSGSYALAGGTRLHAGDSVRGTEPFEVSGTGELLVVELRAK